MELRKIFRVRGDWNDKLLAEYLLPKYDKLRKIYRDKRHSISKTPTTYRVINHWSNVGLLAEDNERGSGWRKFSLTDLLWIYILIELRAFGMSLVALKCTYKWLFYNGESEDHTDFELYLSLAFKKKGVVIVVVPDGEAKIMLEEEYHGQYQPVPLPTSHIIINVNEILSKILNKPDLKYREELTTTLNNKEADLLNSIRYKEDLNEVNLKVRDRQIGKVNYTTKVENPKHLTSLLTKIQKENADRDIVLKQKDGKIVLLEIVDTCC